MSLKAVYEDPARTSRDPRVLASRAGGSVKSAEAFLREQESSQLAKQWRKPSASSGAYTPTGAPAGHWQADVTFLEDYKGVNDRRKAILTVLNTTTRFAVARPLLAATADKTAEAMREVLAELSAAKRNIQVLRVDGGGEFKGAFRELMHEAGIELEVSEATYHRWRRQYSGMELQTLKRLKALEQENARLKRIVADQVIDISILKEVAEGNF